MSPANFRIALLLLFATVVQSSVEVRAEEEEDFPSQLWDVSERHDAEEILQDGAFPGSCRACKSIVSAIKKKLGSDHSKVKIGRMLNNACNRVKSKLIRSACNKLVRKYKDKLIDAIANSGTPRAICVKLRLCSRNK